MKFLPILLGALAALAGGCASAGGRSSAQAHAIKPYAPKNYVGSAMLPLSVKRVVLLPVHGGDFAPAETCEGFDPVFAAALQRQVRFEVVPMSREECSRTFGTADVASTAALPRDFLQRLGETYGAQAVMFVDITVFDPYRPLSLGIRAKLASVSDRRLIWSFDEVYTSLNPAVVDSLRRYYLQSVQKNSPIDLSADALESPRQFAAYAAYTTFSTLPRR